MTMFKKAMTLLLAVSLFGCSQQELNVVGEVTAECESSTCKKLQLPASDSVQYYFSQAQVGIGDAYVKMAQYYRDGTLGNPNLLMVMQMGYMAEMYKAIPNMDALFKDIPSNDIIRITYEAFDLLNHTESEDTLMAKAEELVGMGIAEGYTMQAVLAFMKKDTERALALCDKGIEGGSAFACIAKDIIIGGDEFGKAIRPETLVKIADRFPMAFVLLGDYYAKIPRDSAIDVPLAIQYYLSASEHACLGRREARWVLVENSKKSYLPIDSTLIERLLSLGRNQINDSTYYLP